MSERERNRRRYSDYLRRRSVVIETLGGVCFLCDTPAKSHFNFHHVRYEADSGQQTGQSKGWAKQLRRLQEAEKHPARFRLLCPGCHWWVTVLRKKMRHVNWSRLRELVHGD